jgi:hypothetical protein
VETVGWEGQGVVCGTPLVSVKDRWVDHREQVLNIPIACWYLWVQ